MLLFDPTNPVVGLQSAAGGAGGEWEVRDVQNIADILVDPEGALDKRNHWEKPAIRCWSARSCMFSMRNRQDAAGVASFLSDPPVEATLRAMMNTPHLGEAGVHPVIASSAANC